MRESSIGCTDILQGGHCDGGISFSSLSRMDDTVKIICSNPQTIGEDGHRDLYLQRSMKSPCPNGQGLMGCVANPPDWPNRTAVFRRFRCLDFSVAFCRVCKCFLHLILYLIYCANMTDKESKDTNKRIKPKVASGLENVIEGIISYCSWSDFIASSLGTKLAESGPATKQYQR